MPSPVCHSGENKLSKLMLGIFSDQERALPPSRKIRELTFVVKKHAMMLSRVSIFRV